ncbi:unnamed protein product [Urochloa humidicola]
MAQRRRGARPCAGRVVGPGRLARRRQLLAASSSLSPSSPTPSGGADPSMTGTMPCANSSGADPSRTGTRPCANSGGADMSRTGTRSCAARRDGSGTSCRSDEGDYHCCLTEFNNGAEDRDTADSTLAAC